MSQAAPIPARFYPAGGDAHGHPALVELVGDVLQVLPEDSPPRQVPLPGLQAATRGFNHSQWAIAWAAGGGGEHMLLVDEAAVSPLRALAPALFAGGEDDDNEYGAVPPEGGGRHPRGLVRTRGWSGRSRR